MFYVFKSNQFWKINVFLLYLFCWQRNSSDIIYEWPLKSFFITYVIIYRQEEIDFAFFSLNLTRIQFKWSVWIYTVPSFTCPDIVHNQITFRWKDLLLLLFWWCWDAPGRHNNNYQHGFRTQSLNLFSLYTQLFCLLLYIHMFCIGTFG